MIGMLNLGSLVLGIIAWILPIFSLSQDKEKRNLEIYSIMSLLACVISLFFQLIYNHHLVQIEDWSALMDTSGGVVVAASVLLVVTIVLNIINFVVRCDKI